MLTIGSLFAGIGGLELGLEWAGLGPVLWQVEINPFCRSVLAKHWPSATRYTDVTDRREFPHVDLICGGAPCQDLSGAGKGAGLHGQRSGLWYHFARVISEVRPRFVVVENVASGAKRWLCPVRRQLRQLGYDSTAYALSAADVGAPHLRKRIFVVARADSKRLHQQHRRSQRTSGEGAVLSPGNGPQGDVADANGERQLQPGGGKSDVWGWSGYADGRHPEPCLPRVGHGISHRLDRERALGNAVVPQCGEVIGRIIVDRLTHKGAE